MRKLGKKLTAIGLVITMILQISHLENYRGMQIVSAAMIEDTTDLTEESGKTDRQKTEQESTSSSETTESETSVSDTTNDEPTSVENPTTPDGEEGTNTQTVDTQEENSEVPRSADTYIDDDIVWKDFSVSGDVIEGSYANQEAVRLTSDLLIKGTLAICYPLDLNGHTLTVEGAVTQLSDFIIDGDFIAYANYVWIQGNTVFENGYADIAGDFQLESNYECVFAMEHETDYLLIEGNLTLSDNNKLTTSITDGTLELKGDFTQKVKVSSGDILYPDGDFYAGGNSTLLLSGGEQQNIYVAKETSGFKNIAVATYGLEKDEDGNYLFGDRLIGFSGQCNYEEYEDYGCPTTYGYAVFNGKKLRSNIIYGSCYYDEVPWHLSSSLLVIGDFIQNGDLYLEGGNLEVYGDYRIQSIDETGEYGETEGKLVVQTARSLYIYGDFVTESVTDHTGLLTNGNWYIYGGIYQYGKSAKNFVTSNSLQINIDSKDHNQERECHIVMDNPVENTISYLYKRVSNIKMVIEKGVLLEGSSSLGAYSGYVIVKNVTGYTSYDGDVRILSDANISGTLSVSGNLIVGADVTVAGTIEVKKDMIVEKGVLTIDGGKVSAVDVSFQEGSDSALVMEEAASMLSCEGFYYGSNRPSGNLTGGSIRFNKDFYVKDTGTPDSFVCSDTHAVMAYGNGVLQQITIENPASNIETLYVYTNGPVRPANGTVIHNVINSYGTYVWEGIEGYTLEQDVVYDEDFFLAYGTLDLNGHTLTVNGDFYAEQGSVYIHGGNLVVNGNLNLTYRDWQTGEPVLKTSKADIIMTDERDRIEIAGDFYAVLSTDSLRNMQKGTVSLAGEMKIDGTIGQFGSSRPTVMDGVSLYFTGNGKHSITGSSANMLLRVGDCIASDVQEVSVEIPIRINGALQLPKDYQFYDITVQSLDKIDGHTFKGDIAAYSSILTDDVRIEGDLSIKGATSLCGYNIHADTITVSAETHLSGGGLYAQQLYMNSRIYMQNPEDIIKTGDFYVAVTTSASDYMTEGNIYITGNFTDNTGSYYAFLPSGNHTVIFELPANATATITFNNDKSILNRAVFNNRIDSYTINRNRNEIAKELIIGYDDKEKPETPKPVICKDYTYCVAKLQWNKVTDNMGVDYYKLYRDGVCVAQVTDTYYIDMGLRPHTVYNYTVSAVDLSGNESEQSEATKISTFRDIDAPVRWGFPIIEVVGGSITITCNDVFRDANSYVDYYILTKDGKEVARLTNSASLSYYDMDTKTTTTRQIQDGNPVYTEEGQQYGELHEYCLYAVDAAGNVSEKYPMKIAANFPPGIPKGFSAASENGYNILFFEKTGDGECEYYYVYRDGKHIKTILNDKKENASYIDTDVIIGNSYTYYIVANNMYDVKSEPTEECKVTTVDENIPPVIEEIRSSIPGNIINEDLQLQVKASDNGGIKSIRAFIVEKGEKEETEIYKNESSEAAKSLTTEFTLKSKDLQGTYELHIVVSDYSNNETEQVLTYKINIDGLPPVKILTKRAMTTAIFLEWEEIEGAAYYLVEKNEGSFYRQIQKTETTSCQISDLRSDTKYRYRIVAYDKNGIRGLAMEDMILATKSDLEAPKITKVYENNCVLGPNTSLEISYSDNIRVSKVRAYYRKSGEQEWNLINETVAGEKSGSTTLEWKKDGLLSGTYEVRYEAEDSSENLSDELIRTYTLDLDGPVIHNLRLTPKDWEIQLDWDDFEDEDYSRYEIKRFTADEYDAMVRQGENFTDNVMIIKKGKSETAYVEMISPKEEYVYILYAYDIYGNVSTAAVRGRSIDNDIFPPTLVSLSALFAAKDVEMSLSADGSTDNDEIASYEWDMGNGDVVYGKECEYTYSEPGTYDLTLTAVDKSGNSSSKTTTVTVAKDVGMVEVTVVSGIKKIADANVVIRMNGQICHSSGGSLTDNKGMLSFPMAPGTYQIAVYKQGYIAKTAEVVVEIGKKKTVKVNLEEGEVVTAKFKTHEMTKEQMEKAGIDTTSNETVFEYTVDLEFDKDEIETVTFNSTQNHADFRGGYYGAYFGGIGNNDKDKEKKKKQSYYTVDNVSDNPAEPVFVLTRTVNVSISWLEDIYQVDVIISNEASETIDLENAKAALIFPPGLELASMKKGENIPEWNIGTIKGGESKTHTWFVGGTETGKYRLKVDLDAVLQPFNQKISKTLVASDDLEINIGKGLELYIYPEENAYIGEDYYVQFKLSNASEEDYHYVTTDFGPFETTPSAAKVIRIIDDNGVETAETVELEMGINYYMPEGTSKNANVILQKEDKLTVDTLKAGESICGTWKFQFDAAGDINREYYRLLTEYEKTMNANGTNVTVILMPIASHLTKKRLKIIVHNRIEDPPPPPPPQKDPPSTPDSTKTVKDPVNLMTGAFMVDHVVAAVAGADTLRFGLSYNSLYTDAAGEVGKGWYHDYEMHIERNGSLLALYQNPYEVRYFEESEETANVVRGTIEDDTIILADDSSLERTYYQAGVEDSKYQITKNQEGYIVSDGQMKYTFDQEGTLTGYVNESGQKVVVTRTEDKLTITDQATGKSITASYNEDGRITNIADAAGKKTLLSYEDDCMTVLTSKTGKKLVYEYDEQGHILRGKDGEQTVYVENTYDETGRVLTQVSNGKKKEQTNFAYSENEDGTLSVTMTNADGTTEKTVSDKYGQGIYYENAIGGVTEYSYNELDDMTAYRQPDGSGADYTYDEAGNITKVVETTGKTSTYSYDGDNRVTRMVCNDSTDIQYTYNTAGQIETVTGSNGLKESYTYDENGQILTETSELGTITYKYQDGMLRSITDYSGNTHSFTYDANGNVTQYVDGAGVVTDYKVDVSGRVTEESVVLENGKKATVSYTYDDYGKMLSKTDAEGNTTNYAYDEEDRLIKETRPDGTFVAYSYDANGHLTKIIYPDGETVEESVYDAAGNALSLTNTLKDVQTASYSAGSQLLSMMQSNGGEIQYTYYDNGLLKSQTDANGNTTTLVYDDAGRVSKVTDGAGAATTFGYDRDGNLTSVENALGNSIKMKYNEYRKVIRQTDANGNETIYDYDKALNCIRATDAEGGVTEFAYDAAGQIISMTKKGETKTQDVTISMTYDNLGNVTSLTDGEGNTSRMEYDLNSNLTAVYDAKGVKTESYVYDSVGNCTEVTDALGNVTKNSYDAMGNLIKQMNEATGNAVTYSYVGGIYLSSSTDAMDNTASATYDSMGNMSTLTNPNGGVTSYKYDLNNNLTDEIIGEDYHIRYAYNAQNLAASKTNSRNQQAVYEYDALGRITKQSDEAGVIEYTYDANDNVLTVKETVGSTVNTITRTYDGLNRVTSYEDAKGNKIKYGYDKLGNLVSLTYPNGKVVHYTYDKNGNIKAVTDWNGRVTTYDYDVNGRLVKTERPNKTVETRTYDKAGRLTQILDKCGETIVNQQDYSYDAEGNITEVKQLYSGELNFIGVTSAKMTYDKNNRLLTYNGEKIQYDKDGNMTYGPLQGKMTKFEFDCRNRLVKAGDTSYTYDAENNRIAVTTGAKRTEYVINTQPELSQVLQSTVTNGSKVEATYYFYGRGLIAQDNEDSGYLTYHFNNVGSTMAVTDQTGEVKYSYNYSPYGELLEGEYNDIIPFLYNGQYGVTTDANGLYYMRARYYNVDIKRFINQDVLTGTLERISSLNRYSYVEGNPVSYLDPFGLAKSIYDDAYDWLQAGEEILLYFNTFLDGLGAIKLTSMLGVPLLDELLAVVELIPNIVVYGIELGICIGRAWEGVFENDYGKIDTSYEMMAEVIGEFALTLGTIAIDSVSDLPITGLLFDLKSHVQNWLDKYL